MKLTLYKCSCEKNKVNKSRDIAGAYAMDGNLRDQCSIIDPVIIIKKDNPTISMYNYAYISEFKRYYFITNIVSIRNDLWEVSLHVDVLYTWASYIRTNKAVIDKAQNTNYNQYLDDKSLIFDSHVYNQVIMFSNGFNEQGTNILICAGGQ